MWKVLEKGIEVNRDPASIEAILIDVKQSTYWLTFVSGGFRSGPTLLLDVTDKYLVFDRPRPWASALNDVRVIYRDADHIEHFFRVRVLKESRQEEFIYTSKPDAIYRQERRMYYRVPTPSGSAALFYWKERAIRGDIKDICAGGAALIKSRRLVPMKEILRDGSLDLFLSATKRFGMIEIPEAEVVRSQKTSYGVILGIKFHIDDKKKDEIMRYVFQRQIEMRKAKVGE